jgi:ABC-type antimicrobial peptide transport system permease subunit
VRIALGAQRTRILGLTFRNVLRLTFAGSVCGFLIAFLLGTIFRSALYLVPHVQSGILYKVGIHDPLSFASAASVLMLFAVLAGLLPALRASRIDPCETLRCE